jgi:hypothetical protein
MTAEAGTKIEVVENFPKIVVFGVNPWDFLMNINPEYGRVDKDKYQMGKYTLLVENKPVVIIQIKSEELSIESILTSDKHTVDLTFIPFRIDSRIEGVKINSKEILEEYLERAISANS